MEEIWKDVIGLEGKYQVSTIGRVKSLDYLTNHNYGGLKRIKGRVLKPQKNLRGYLMVNIGSPCRSTVIHRIVAKTFLESIEGKDNVNHINGDKHDNRSENLEWVTAKENTRHAIESGLTDNSWGKNCNAKTVINMDNGIFYDTIKEAWIASGLNIRQSSFENILSGHRKNKTSFKKI